MPDNIDTFPQHRAGKRKPTVFEIVNDSLKAGQSEDAINAILGKFYPEMTRADLMTAYRDEAIRALPGGGKDQTRDSFAEQRVREEINRQLREIGIPLIED